MPKAFNLSRNLLPAGSLLNFKDPRVAMRGLLIVLAVANLVAALIYFRPWGGSADDLSQEQAELRQRLNAMQSQLTKAKALVNKAEHARKDGDDFLTEYTTDRRTTFSTIFAELDRVARESGVQPRPMSYELHQVEGSDNLYQLTITAAYESNYASLTKFVNLLDRSPRFLIIESLIASPQQTNNGDLLAVSIKLDTFVREELPGLQQLSQLQPAPVRGGAGS